MASPYVVSILPDPLDYFEGCALTYDCETKCHDSLSAFASTKEMIERTSNLPVYRTEDTFFVNSEFYIEEDIEKGLHVAPFVILDIMELDPVTCLVVCNSAHNLDRCVFVAGQDPNYLDHVASAYYCIPADFLTSVYQYDALPYPDYNYNVSMPNGRITLMRILSNYKIHENARDAVVTVSVNEETNEQYLFLITHVADPILLLRLARPHSCCVK